MELKEKLYWMQLNDQGVDEIGYLMTKDQLLKELPDVYEASVFGDTSLRQPRQTNAEDVERYIKEDMEAYHQDVRGFEGEYSPNCTFFVQEVTDAAELIELITWKDYDPCEGYTAVEMNEEYPDYVPKELRLSACVYGNEPGWTSENLPRSGAINPTIEKYAKELDLGLVSGLRKDYTDVEKAAIDISKTLHYGDLTREEFGAICDFYNVYLAYDIQWDMDEKENDLPVCVVIPAEVAEEARKAGDVEIISDWLSDEYGFCHEGFKISEKLEHTMDYIAGELENTERG